MTVVADTHVHIYPFYKVEEALHSIQGNLGKFANASLRIACLTERYDCELYAELRDAPRESVSEHFSISSGNGFLEIVDRASEGQFHLLPGQQVITAENIEILSLNCETRVQEGRSAPDTVEDILAAGGVPVAAWAPGKWFFSRGQVVSALLDAFTPSQLALGDTTLRPIGWLTPNIIRNAKNRGFKVLFGSDPLPFSGEESTPGTYLTTLDFPDPFATENPAELMRNVLHESVVSNNAGGRGSFPKVLNRLYRNHRAPTPARH
ncbi:MAG: hypothetical protein KTR18_03765 [Acidiferrobacterales bacterium]|nr:hypothetical protein [Acidiferrobacterales bacterium]